MTHQSEAQLEKSLIERLGRLGFEGVSIEDSEALEQNLRSQLEKFNNVTFSDQEFERILNHLKKGDRYYKAKTLRDYFNLVRDDGTSKHIRFFNMDQWCKNLYQVTRQVTQVGRYENRYDVTLLINGLPLVQVELKRRGVEMKEAFNQIQRYHKHSFTGTLFEYAQIFVISNGVNTKYFSNNPKQSFEQTFFWTDGENRKITQLEQFTDVFLEKCAISEMIAEYIVLAESLQIPMVLRPYQYYAVKAIERRVIESGKNGYIWHTTGSGKTLTSFKTSQILSRNPDIKKILFVVDRKDLDIQTTKEFNSFSDGSVDGTDNTRHLVSQLADQNRKLIVTTIQKLDIAIGRESYLKQFEYLKNEKVVIIFDECHRSQFGETHAHIKSFFTKAQLFGFTGTPIFAENNVGGVTTADVFSECLHKYIITNAISDNNVLGFSVEYVGKYTQKDQDVLDADIFADALVEGINTKEVLESQDRLEKIADYVLADWRRKTKNGKFNAIFAVSSVEVLKRYYTLLKTRKPEGMTIATIFTYHANEEDRGDMGDLDTDPLADGTLPVNQHSRDFLDECIKDYNDTFSTSYASDRFYEYYKDLQKKIKQKEVDLVLVVNMFLTGFDSPRLNTLYVDKNLRYHGLIQAYSRTNRLLNSDKPHGNIISFRNLKEATDKALALYGDENAKEVVFKKPYEEQKKEFEVKLQALREHAPSVDAVDDLQGEQEKANFVQSFRDLLRIKSSLETFAEFSFDDLGITEQEFYDYQSKYLDIYERRKQSETESVLDQIDFELELTVRDIINFDYIIQLIAGLKNVTSDAVREKKIDEILRVFDRDATLRKKKDLIRKFIEENLPKVDRSEDVEHAFSEFWSSERSATLRQLSETEKITLEQIEELIGEYLYTDRLPNGEDIVERLPERPRLMEHKTVINRIREAIKDIVDVFEW
jgi:type I restriction enzyme R subunit